MSVLDNLALGVSTVLQQQHLLLLVVGCVLGIAAAAMPGIGVLPLIAMALPVALVLDPTAAMMLLVGMYLAAAPAAGAARRRRPSAVGDGAATPAGLPAAPLQTTRPIAVPAPLLLLLASLIGALAIVVVAPWLIELTFLFGPAEYFSMTTLWLLAVVVLTGGSLVKSLAMLVLGLLLAQIGGDPSSGAARFALGHLPVDTGVGFIPLAIGLVVVGRIVSDLVGPAGNHVPSLPAAAPLPVRTQLREHGGEAIRGSAVGALLGVVPGGGVLIGASLAQLVERRLRAPAPADTAASVGTAHAAALVAGARSSLVPLLALGVPANAALALVIGLMLQRGVQVGPQLMTGRPELFWGLVVAAALTGAVLLALARPAVLLSRRLETVPYTALYPVIGTYCCLAVLALPGGWSGVVQMGFFGVLGHLLFKFGCPLAPLLMGFVLGPTIETSLRHALELSAGDWGILLTRPISAGLLLTGALLLVALLLPSIRPRRAALFEQER